MEKQFMPFYPISINEVGQANTISNGPDNGANNNMAGIFWNSMRHSTFEQAVNNFLSRLPAFDPEMITSLSNLNIGGHGSEGFLTTGCGQTGQQNYMTNTMASWNKYYWDPHFSKVKNKNFSIMAIYSCHSGAGESGADFLFDIAKSIGHPCQGRTGFTYSNAQSLWFEANSVWQVATPTHRPAAINAPTPHLNNYGMRMLLEIEGKIEEVDHNKITSIKLTKVGYLGTRSQKEIIVSRNELPDISGLMFGSTPFKIDGDPLAEVTGLVEIQVKTRKGTETRIFEIYNDRIMIERNTRQNYFVNPALINYMNNQ